MFNTGDTVSYGTSGVCTIAEKKRLTLGGQPHECFILRPGDLPGGAEKRQPA